MSYDDLNAPNNASHGAPDMGFVPKTGLPRSDAARVRDAQTDERPLADREVPLSGSAAMIALHQWLDGEATLASVRATSGGNDAVDLWTRINDEAELLRSRKTPLYVHKRIMEALPPDIYRMQQPWYRRPVAINPAAMLVAGAALVGIGVLVATVAVR